MRKNIYLFVSIFVFSFISGSLSLSIIPFHTLIAFILRIHPLKSFVLGFLATGFCWLMVALYLNSNNHSTIVEMISTIFMNIGTNNLYLITALIGGITGGLACWVGAAFAHYFTKETV